MSATAVGPWADNTFGRAYDEARLSGLGIVTVQDGRVSFQKTYGYADFAGKRPIDPHLTRFRIGSTSKTILVATIGRLRQEGKIASFDDAANQYLKRIKLPRWNGREITLWDLMNHKGGFEERAWYFDHVTLPLTHADVRRQVPLQDFKSQDTSNYCNFCTSVLGLMVEDITGQLLADAEDERVFRPLGMSQSFLNMSTVQSPNVGIPYTRLAATPAPFPYSSIPEFFAAAGSVDATMDDMGRYMIAMLGGAGGEILSADTRVLMFTPHAQNAPNVSGFGMIWMLHDWNGVKVIEHGGQILGYHTMLSLFPESNAGIFISCFCADLPIKAQPGAKFSLTGYNFREMIYQHFLGAAPMIPISGVDPAPYTGYYEAERGDTRWPYRMLRIFKPTAFRRGITHVKADQGGLMVNGFGPYLAVKKDVFRFPDLNRGDPYVPYPNLETLTFLRSTAGEVDRISPPLALATSRKISLMERPELQRVLLFGGAALAALAVLNGFWALPHSRQGRWARITAWTLSISSIALVGITWSAFTFQWLGGEFLYAYEMAIAWLFALVAILVTVSAAGTTLVAAAMWRGWSGTCGRAPLLFRINAILAATGGLALTILVMMNH